DRVDPGVREEIAMIGEYTTIGVRVLFIDLRLAGFAAGAVGVAHPGGTAISTPPETAPKLEGALPPAAESHTDLVVDPRSPPRAPSGPGAWKGPRAGLQPRQRKWRQRRGV